MSCTPPTIRPFQSTDWDSVLPLLQQVFVAGETYAYAPDSSPADIHRAWIEFPAATFVAVAGNDGNSGSNGSGNDRERIVGTYYIKPNQPGLGNHVCNCGYVTAPDAAGQGIATLMCEHSQRQAVAMGFRAMQFNLVVSTNERAVRLWNRLGYATVGVLPRAYRHRRLGYVDALVMYKELVS